MASRTVASVTAMDQPLGSAVGNLLEVEEAIATLRGGGPADLRTLAIELAVELLVAAGHATETAARDQAAAALDTGAALEMLARLVEAQGGSPTFVEHPERLAHAPVEQPVFPSRDGFVRSIEADQVGLLAMRLGAGRERKEDRIDHRVGIRLLRKVGDEVRRGEPIATIAAATDNDAADAAPALLSAFRFSDQAPAPPDLILGRHGIVH